MGTKDREILILVVIILAAVIGVITIVLFVMTVGKDSINAYDDKIDWFIEQVNNAKEGG